jgi:pectate lyase
MRRTIWIMSIALTALTGGPFGARAQEKPVPAFPGAEGFGARTPGGRGGKVMIVTNLNPDGPGSLQEACAAEGPRIVVFEVSGVISNTITIEHSNITIAGQTAPGAGITIEGMLVAKPGIRDIVVRFVRVRPRPVEEGIRPKEEGGGPLAVRLSKIGVRLIPPDEGPFDEYDAIKLTRTSYVVLDHVSMSWSVDEAIDMCYTHHATIQWCTIEEAAKGHTKYGGLHNFGPLAAYAPTYSTFHHNLFANLSRRCPAVREGPSDVRNNVVYNFQHGFSHDLTGVGNFNIVGNCFKRGPNSGTTVAGARWTGPTVKPIGSTGGATYSIHDNLLDGKPIDVRGGKMRDRATDMPAVAMHSAAEAYDLVLTRAGAFPRDAVTRRTIEEVRAGKGDWGRRDPEGGLMAGLKASDPPLDTDRDGMPDAWEKKHGLDPGRDDSAKVMADGYTAIEVYINESAEQLIRSAAVQKDPPRDSQ